MNVKKELETVLDALPAWSTKRVRLDVEGKKVPDTDPRGTQWREVKNPECGSWQKDERSAGVVAQLAVVCKAIQEGPHMDAVRADRECVNAFAQVSGLAGKGRRGPEAVAQFISCIPVLLKRLPKALLSPVAPKPAPKTTGGGGE